MGWALNQLRIAYFVNQYPKISHTFIRREILALERQGFDILRVSLRGWNDELTDEEDRIEQTNTRYILRSGMPALLWAVLLTMLAKPGRFLSALRLATTMARQRGERSLPYHLAYLAEACRMLPWLKEFGATHVHAHFGSNSAEVAMLVHALGGPPYSFTFHGEQESLSGGIGDKVGRAAFVVAISSYARSQLYRLVNYSHWSKVKVVHCGLETAFHSVKPVPLPSNRRLVCIGRLCVQKAQVLLIEAVHRLALKSIKFELVLAGDGEMRKVLEEMIKRYGLEKQVRISGWISSNQVREEILAARGLVLASFAEGLPVVIMEAMALRRPVLASCITGIPELVQPGKTGWLFPAGSIEDLASALEEFLDKPDDELREMGETAYARVLERHSIDTEAAKLASLFRESCQGNIE
jgi:glycosyltransferase involved in cell wall biosynthesis